MRILIALTSLCALAFGHGGAPHAYPEAKEKWQFGGFADLQYRTDTLYPTGPSGTFGYELHGEEERVEAEHLGLFARGPLGDSFDAAVELNRHNGADATLNDFVERAYVRYTTERFSLRAGRMEYALSFVARQPWGYGFSQMPLGLETYARSALYGDGLSASYTSGNVRLDADILADQYSHVMRSTLKASGSFHALGASHSVLAYAQYQDEEENLFDTSPTHTHSHGTGCDALSPGQFCFDTQRTLLGAGYTFSYSGARFQTEWLKAFDRGTVRSSEYKVDRNGEHNALYAQLLYALDAFEGGARYERFWFTNEYDGGGAAELAAQIEGEGRHSSESLTTLMLSYRLLKEHTFRIEYATDNDESLWRFQYVLFLLWE
jgi:hypothetical protein